MKKEEFYYDSADGKTKIRAVRYTPEKTIKGILQIAHGMVEFIDRYDEFAKYLCDKGYVVTGNDHLGHGSSVLSKNDWGYFAENDGYLKVIEDVKTLHDITKELHPNVPYYLLGHSMGSFICRAYIARYGDDLSGAIVMGTGQQNAATLAFGKAFTKLVAKFKGWRYRSKAINALVLGSNNKRWEPSNTHCDWLSKNSESVGKYINDPRNSFVFTTNGFYNLFMMIGEVIDIDKIKKIPKTLPILIVSGQDDPVGKFGKDPQELTKIYKDVGIKDVELKLYENDRHEILNELDREVVFNDIYNWLEKNNS